MVLSQRPSFLRPSILEFKSGSLHFLWLAQSISMPIRRSVHMNCSVERGLYRGCTVKARYCLIVCMLQIYEVYVPMTSCTICS